MSMHNPHQQVQLTALCALLFSLPVMAGDWVAGQFSGNAELGILVTSGNTQSTTIKNKLDISHELTAWRNQYVMEIFAKTDKVKVDSQDDAGNPLTVLEDKTTAERYLLSGQGNYKLADKTQSLFVFGSAEKDRFAGIDYRLTMAGGWSKRWLETQEQTLDIEVGPGIKRESIIDQGASTATIVRVAATYEYLLSENATFKQTFASDVALGSGENTATKAETSVVAKLFGDLSMKAAFLVKHNSSVDDDRKSTDTETSLTVVYQF